MDSLAVMIILLFGALSVASGLIGAIGLFSLYKDPRQRSALNRKAIKLILALAMGLLLGIAELAITMLLSFGSYSIVTLAIGFFATVSLVTGGIYLGYSLGIAVVRHL